MNVCYGLSLTRRRSDRFRRFSAVGDIGDLRPLSGNNDVVSYGWVGSKADHLLAKIPWLSPAGSVAPSITRQPSQRALDVVLLDVEGLRVPVARAEAAHAISEGVEVGRCT